MMKRLQARPRPQPWTKVYLLPNLLPDRRQKMVLCRKSAERVRYCILPRPVRLR